MQMLPLSIAVVHKWCLDNLGMDFGVQLLVPLAKQQSTNHSDKCGHHEELKDVNNVDAPKLRNGTSSITLNPEDEHNS